MASLSENNWCWGKKRQRIHLNGHRKFITNTEKWFYCNFSSWKINQRTMKIKLSLVAMTEWWGLDLPSSIRNIEKVIYETCICRNWTRGGREQWPLRKLGQQLPRGELLAAALISGLTEFRRQRTKFVEAKGGRIWRRMWKGRDIYWKKLWRSIEECP